jgi:hypothetical protein
VANIDPRLKSILNAAVAEEKVKAVITVIGQPTTGNTGSAQTRTNLAEEILSRTERETNQKPANYKYYSKLGVLMVEATNSFIQKLIENPEISTAALAKEDDVYRV